MRTQEEIVEKICGQGLLCVSGFVTSCLFDGLDYEHARKVGCYDSNHCYRYVTDADVISQIEALVPRAFEKALLHKGVLVSGLVGRLGLLLWLIGKDDLLENVPYANYGVPMLFVIANEFKLSIPDGDEGAILEAMSNGVPCPNCLAGESIGCL